MALTRAKRDVDFQVTNTTPTIDPITLSRTWIESNNSTGNFSNPTTVDTNRLGVIIVNLEDTGGATTVSTVSVSGQVATKVVDSFLQTSFSNESSCFYFTEAQLQFITDGDPVIVTYSNGNPAATTVYSAILSGVSQTNPIVVTDTFESTGGSGTVTAITVTGGYSLVVVNSGQQANANISQNSLDYTEIFNQATASDFTSALYVYEDTSAGTLSTQWSVNPLRTVSFMVNFRRF